jgi:hypothetical protein
MVTCRAFKGKCTFITGTVINLGAGWSAQA